MRHHALAHRDSLSRRTVKELLRLLFGLGHHHRGQQHRVIASGGGKSASGGGGFGGGPSVSGGGSSSGGGGRGAAAAAAASRFRRVVSVAEVVGCFDVRREALETLVTLLEQAPFELLHLEGDAFAVATLTSTTRPLSEVRGCSAARVHLLQYRCTSTISTRRTSSTRIR